MLDALRVALIVFLCFFTIFSVNSVAVGEESVIEQWDDISTGGLVATLYSTEGNINNLHLVISGEGEVIDFDLPEDTPWHDNYSQLITRVTLNAGVSYVGQNSFYSLENLEAIYVENFKMTFPSSTDNIIPERTVIFGHISSTAKMYAEEYARIFKPTCRFLYEPCECGYICNEPLPLCTPGYCSVCKTTHSDTSVHVSNGVTVEAIPPGCESAGRVAHTNCIHCGIPLDASENPIEKVELPPLSHSLVWTKEILSSCEASGAVGHFTCVACGKIFDEERNEISEIEIESMGHTGGSATCTQRARCDVCEKEYGELDPSSHGYSAGIVYDENGHASACACGAHTEFLPHTYTEKVIKAPTELFVGQKQKSCVCGYKMIEEIPRLEMPENESDSLDEGEPPSILVVIFLSALGVTLAAVTTFLLVRIALTHKSDEKGENDV